MKSEGLTLTISKPSENEFWLDGPEKKIAAKFFINTKSNEILYDVYSTIENTHLKAETLKDVQQNEFIEEENRRWKTAMALEEIWLVIDALKLWSEKNNFTLKETELI